MKTIEEIRRENLAILRDELKGVGQLALKIERGVSQVSQWLNGSKNSKTGKPRGMNDETCRLVEEKCGKPRGWMDTPHGEDAETSDGALVAPREIAELVLLYGKADRAGREAIMTMARVSVGESATAAANDEL